MRWPIGGNFELPTWFITVVCFFHFVDKCFFNKLSVLVFCFSSSIFTMFINYSFFLEISMFKKIDIFWSIYLAHRCFKFDVSIDDIIDVSKILRIPKFRL
jgi:hypothetical protein